MPGDDGGVGVPTGEVPLDAAQCRSLMASECTGRIVFTRGALPECRPVAFTWDGDWIVFAVDDPVVARAIAGSLVAAFEVDGVDPTLDVPWTVLALGETSRILSAVDETRLRPLLHGAWAAGPSAEMLALRPERLSGVCVAHP